MHIKLDEMRHTNLTPRMMLTITWAVKLSSKLSEELEVESDCTDQSIGSGADRKMNNES